MDNDRMEISERHFNVPWDLVGAKFINYQKIKCRRRKRDPSIAFLLLLPNNNTCEEDSCRCIYYCHFCKNSFRGKDSGDTINMKKEAEDGTLNWVAEICTECKPKYEDYLYPLEVKEPNCE